MSDSASPPRHPSGGSVVDEATAGVVSTETNDPPQDDSPADEVADSPDEASSVSVQALQAGAADPFAASGDGSGEASAAVRLSGRERRRAAAGAKLESGFLYDKIDEFLDLGSDDDDATASATPGNDPAVTLEGGEREDSMSPSPSPARGGGAEESGDRPPQGSTSKPSNLHESAQAKRKEKAAIFKLPVTPLPKQTALESLVHLWLGQPGLTLRRKSKPAANDVSPDVEGLVTLMEAGCWRPLLLVSQMAAATTDQPHEILRIRLCRTVALMKLRMFREAQRELDALGTLAKEELLFDGYPDHYADEARTGTMVPFALRVLHSELMCRLNNSQLTLDRLLHLLKLCRSELEALGDVDISGVDASEMDAVAVPDLLRQADDPSTALEAYRLWRAREVFLLFSLVNHLCREKDYMVALDLLQGDLFERVVVSPGLLSALGRVYLLLGDIQGARAVFEEVEAMVPVPAKHMQVVLNAGFLLVAAGKFAAANLQFENALKIDPWSVLAANNRALCLLYSGHLRDAISALEAILDDDPEHNINESVIYNLTTLYDLAGAPIEKKTSLLERVATHAGDDFNVANLKLPDKRY